MPACLVKFHALFTATIEVFTVWFGINQAIWPFHCCTNITYWTDMALHLLILHTDTLLTIWVNQSLSRLLNLTQSLSIHIKNVTCIRVHRHPHWMNGFWYTLINLDEFQLTLINPKCLQCRRIEGHTTLGFLELLVHYYRLRLRVNKFGSVCLSVRLCVCTSSPVWIVWPMSVCL